MHQSFPIKFDHDSNFVSSLKWMFVTLAVMSTIAAPQLRQSTVTSSNISPLDGSLPLLGLVGSSNCRGEFCENKKDILIKYVDVRDKKGYHLE